MPKPRYKPLKTTASEREVQRAVFAAFALFGVDAERQNTGAAVNPKGRLVMFGAPGNADITGVFPAHFGPAAGKHFDCEVKAEAFNPRKCYGEMRKRFNRQLARLRTTNEAGGYGWWTQDAGEIPQILTRIREGARIIIDEDDYPTILIFEE